MDQMTSSANCLVRNTWVCGEYLTSRAGEIEGALRQHVLLTVTSVGIGLLIALPAAVLVRRWRPTERWVLGAANVMYTVPSLALFALLVPFTGLTSATVLVGLVLYSLVILIRNTLTGLDSVPDEVTEAAIGMGFGRMRLLLRVELPMAVPAIMAGLRVATVSTIALVTVGAVIDHGGLGNLILDAIGSFFRAEVLTASVLCVLLAIVADLLLVAVERLLVPWRRSLR